jgi:hypothetical protein
LVISSYLNLPEHPQERFRLEQITEAADRWANRGSRHLSTKGVRSVRQRFVSYATGWLTFLDRIEASCPPSGPYDPQIAEFAAFMQQQRGLSPLTIKTRCGTVHRFLSQMYGQVASLDTLTVSDIDKGFSTDGSGTAVCACHRSKLRK